MRVSTGQNILRAWRRHVGGGPIDRKASPLAVVIGDGGFGDYFPPPGMRYQTALDAAEPADIVLVTSVAGPFAEALSAAARLLDGEGYLILALPQACAAGLDAGVLRAAARGAGCVLLESWRDARGPSRDLVAILRPSSAAPVASRTPQFVSLWDGVPGTAAEERLGGAVPYLDVLRQLHQVLAPRHYLEIGVRHGASLALAQGPATGVDPAPEIATALPPTTTIVVRTSDDFFAAGAGGIRPDLAFIDGMHLVENSLHDFMNIELIAANGAAVVIDDIFPNHPAQALRQRRTLAWTGDVWRLPAILARWRPDLFLARLDTAPTGLLLVAGLDPLNRTLWDGYDDILTEALGWDGPPQGILDRTGAVVPDGPGLARVLAEARAAGRTGGKCA
jgi:hypothetical protein